MSANRRVRIIKRTERPRADEAGRGPVGEEAAPREQETSREAARAMQATIAGWVNEHRLRREREARRSYKQLLTEAA